MKNQRNRIWIGGKLKLSTSRPVPFFIVRDFGSSYELGDRQHSPSHYLRFQYFIS
ncbi:putative cytosol aminopeptidase [Gossypium arboreum]|uniref:Putative cytosol aminopeptidase n=1 Tax=Gossypium arboreum TaxID=29729 RepID=A0A0B0PIM1_GOSAR|nr:putative cytosol aminopeptidase [Gossypium arboreum]